MKKATIALLFISKLAYAGPQVQATPIDTVSMVNISTTTNAILQTANALSTFVNSAGNIIINQNSYSLYFSTNTVPITPQQQSDAAAYYKQLKVQLQSQVNSLP